MDDPALITFDTSGQIPGDLVPSGWDWRRDEDQACLKRGKAWMLLAFDRGEGGTKPVIVAQGGSDPKIALRAASLARAVAESRGEAVLAFSSETMT